MKRTAILGIALLSLSALAHAAGEPTPAGTPLNKVPPGAKVQSLPSGLQIADIVVGQGAQPNKGDLCIVHYTAWLEDGRVIGDSKKPKPVDPRDPSKGEKVLPFGFKVGTGQVIPGWDEGVSTMREGGTRLLFIPAQLGYGSKGIGNAVPPDSPLVFRVELLKVKPAPAESKPADVPPAGNKAP